MTSVGLTEQPVASYRLRLAALSLAMLLPSLGTSIANVALPTLAASFHGQFQDVQWVVIAYLLAVTTLIVAAGRVGDMLGRRRVLLFGIGTFAVASALGAMAGNLWVLVALRGVQGLGAAIMMALTVAAVGDMVPKERTGSAMGLLGTVSAVGTALGPSLGGLLVSWFSWPAVFVFMAVAGAAAFVFGCQVFPADAPRERHRFSFDFPGATLLALALGAFALLATQGSTSTSLTSAVLAALAAGGFLAFVVVEARTAEPLVQLGLLRNGALTAGLISMGLVSTIMMATLVVGPFYLSGVLGLSPVATGLVMSVGPCVSALTGVPAGRLVDRFGAAYVTYTGLMAVMIGSVLMTMLPAAFGAGGYVCSLTLITAGYALFQAANTAAVMKGAAQTRRGVISALLGLSRNLGLITGASAMGAVFSLGSSGAAAWAFGTGGLAGLQLTFAVATGLAALGGGAALLGRSHTRVIEHPSPTAKSPWRV